MSWTIIAHCLRTEAGIRQRRLRIWKEHLSELTLVVKICDVTSSIFEMYERTQQRNQLDKGGPTINDNKRGVGWLLVTNLVKVSGFLRFFIL